MRLKHIHLMNFVAGLLGLALTTLAWADITNTAIAMFSDTGGNPYTVQSNTVVVVVSTSVVLPATPTLTLPQYLPLNGTISAIYSGLDPASYYQWSFTPVSQIPSGSSQISGLRPQSGALSAGGLALGAAPSASFTTSSPAANLATQPLGLGPYFVTVVVYDNIGQFSAPAQAYTTLVPTDLSGIRVYPNPWRSDKHTGLPITFDQLAVNSTVKIFTVSGHWVKTLPMTSSSITWDLTNDSGAKVASGLYIYLVTTDQSQKAKGQLAVIK